MSSSLVGGGPDDWLTVLISVPWLVSGARETLRSHHTPAHLSGEDDSSGLGLARADFTRRLSRSDLRHGGDGFNLDLETMMQFPGWHHRPGRPMLAKEPGI